MPVSAFALVGTFVAAAAAIGSAVAWLVGPRRRAIVMLPVAASVVALGSIGHQVKAGFGPTVNLYGYDVRLPFDLGLALVISVVVALGQRLILERRAAR